ncbi:hypothetical protein PanWU01x14_149290, partial [Parasponia andersonii]
MEQVHERMDIIESSHVEQSQIASNMHRRERVQHREARAEDEEYYRDTFGDEDDQDSIV